MKIRVYVVDLEISSRLKRWALRGRLTTLAFGAAICIGGGAAVYAASSNPLTVDEFPAHSLLSSTTLTGTFSAIQTAVRDLQTRTKALEDFEAAVASPVTIVVSSDFQILRDPSAPARKFRFCGTTRTEFTVGATGGSAYYLCGADHDAATGAWKGRVTLTLGHPTASCSVTCF
jgi:hypothetical protein